jgi:hypothetical protein
LTTSLAGLTAADRAKLTAALPVLEKIVRGA